jgi:hypothetical protein
MDLFSAALGGSLYSEIAGLTGLQANTDQRLTNTAERLSALEHRYERMQLVMVALWSLLKEHTGLTDADLKRFMHAAEAVASDIHGNPAVMNCPHCHRIIRKSATTCVWCGGSIETGNAFQGT